MTDQFSGRQVALNLATETLLHHGVMRINVYIAIKVDRFSFSITLKTITLSQGILHVYTIDLIDKQAASCTSRWVLPSS